jgi:hypothetical protein
MQNVRPQLPPGVDPGLKRVPGMSIEFAEYQERVQAFFDAADRVSTSPATTEVDFAELARLSAALEVHNQTYQAWLEQRLRAPGFVFGRQFWLTVALIVAIASVGAFLIRTDRLHFPGWVGQESTSCCIIRGLA